MWRFSEKKDYQQLAVIQRMVRDLNVPVEIVGVPTVREPDGLALSSRNRRLNPEERALAPRLYQALLEAQRLVASGEKDAARIKERVATGLAAAPGMRLEYATLSIRKRSSRLKIDRPSGARGRCGLGGRNTIDRQMGCFVPAATPGVIPL